MNELSDSQKLILVEVRANWSGGSHLMDLIVNRVREQFDNHLRVIRLDFEIYKELLIQFGVDTAPTVLLINKGQIVEVIKETLSQKKMEAIVLNHISDISR
jgi:thioredoxin-like negative regulator of GroEL